MAIPCTKNSDQRESSVFVNRMKQVCLQSRLNDDSDRAHLMSFGIEFKTEEETKEMSDHLVLPYCVQI